MECTRLVLRIPSKIRMRRIRDRFLTVRVISHGPISLKIVVVVLVVATFVQILHLFHEVLVLFIELHRIHEEF